jgi:hypothetical protein
MNIKKYEKEAAQAGEITKQDVTSYIFYGGGRFSWSSKWLPSFRELSEMLVLSH